MAAAQRLRSKRSAFITFTQALTKSPTKRAAAPLEPRSWASAPKRREPGLIRPVRIGGCKVMVAQGWRRRSRTSWMETITGTSTEATIPAAKPLL